MPEYGKMDWEELGPCDLGLKEVVPLRSQTPLGDAGACQVAIVCAQTPEYCNLAYRISSYLQAQVGMSPEISSPEAVDVEQGGCHLIALGNLNDNALLAGLYHTYHVAADAAYPGRGGHVFRTVCDPWGNGRDVLVLGGSDLAGVTTAVDRFLEGIRVSGSRAWVDYTLDVSLGPPFTERCGGIALACTDDCRNSLTRSTYRCLEEGQHRGATPNVAHAGMMYYLTGDEGFARLYLELFKIMYQSAANDTGDGPWSAWGFDADFQSVSMLQAWDLVEHAPVFSDRDRLYITNHLVAYLGNNEEHAVNHRPADERSCRHNHYTFACLGLLFGARYFGRHYGYPHADRWLSLADECFVPQAEAYKANEDCNSYQWLTFSHMLRYAFVRPDPTFLRNGRARLCLDLGVATMDNLGYQVPYGDCASYRGSFSEIGFYKTVAWALRDPMYRDVLTTKEALVPGYGTGGIDPVGYRYDVEFGQGRPMHQFFGGASVPLDPRYYHTFEGKAHVAEDRAFDKVVLRENFNPDGDYLLLDGLSNGGHHHYDGNAIVRLTSSDRIWLADADYMKSPLQFHNTVVVARNGESQLIPPYAELECVANLGPTAYSGTTVSGYTDTDWTRHILWEKERYFLVADQLRAREDGEFDLLCLWRGVGDVSWDAGARVMAIEQGGERFLVEGAQGHSAEVVGKLIHEPMIWASWDQYPHHGQTPDLKVLRQRMRLRLGAGEEALFFHLLGTDGKLPETTFTRLSEGLVSLEVEGCRNLIGTGAALGSATTLTTDAIFASVSPERLVLARATHLQIAGSDVFRAGGPVDLSIDLAAERLSVDAREATRLGFSGGVVPLVGEAPRADVEVLAGTRSLGLSGCVSELQSAVREAVVTAAPEPAPAAAQLPPPASGRRRTPLSEPVWSAQLPTGAHARVLATTDLDGAGVEQAIVGTEEGDVFAVGGGEVLWRFAADGRINAVSCADVDGDGRPEIIVGSADHHVYLLNAHGSEKWRFEVPQYMHEPIVKTVFSADLGLEVGRAVIAGANSCHFHAIDPAGSELWRYEVIHGANHGCAVDFDGDGVDEVLAVTEWWPWHCIGADGKGRWPHWSVRPKLAPGANVVTAGDVNGDGALEMVCGAIDSSVYVFDQNGKLVWQYYTGEEVCDLLCEDLDGEGRVAIIAGSHNGRLYRLDGQGKMVWNRDLGDEVQTVRSGVFRGRGQRELVVGTRGSNVHHLDSRGEILQVLDCGEAVKRIETASVEDGLGVAVATVAGRVAVWGVA